MGSTDEVSSFLSLLSRSAILSNEPPGDSSDQQTASPHIINHSQFPSNQSESEVMSASTSPTDVFLPWNNPYNVISLQTYQNFAKVMFCYVSLGLILVGVPSNFINCVVFYRQGLQERMNLCLFCLALVDFLFVTFFYLVTSYCVVGYFYPEAEQWWNYFTRKHFTGIYHGFLYSSGCLTALIALERCVCVVLPLKAASLLRTRTMAALIAGIVGLIQLAAVVYPLHLEIGSRRDPETGKTILFLTSSEFYVRNKLLYSVVEDTLLMVVVPVITFITVVISTIVTVLELNLRLRWRQLSSSSEGSATRQQVKLVKMLVVVSCIYIVTAAPNVALGLTHSLVPDFRLNRRYANIFLASHLMYMILAMANSSINFFVYVTMSSRFRAHLVAMLCCRPVIRSATDDIKPTRSGSAKTEK
ncbi:hypothetical protein ACOMHN_027696 [Nucella lapillus]